MTTPLSGPNCQGNTVSVHRPLRNFRWGKIKQFCRIADEDLID